MADSTDDEFKEGNQSKPSDAVSNDSLEELMDESSFAETLNPLFQRDRYSEEQIDDDDDAEHPLNEMMTGFLVLWSNWAYFEIKVVKPIFTGITPPRMLMPEKCSGTDDIEFVYPICDFGHTLSTSKASDMFSVGMSMCKLNYTIEKMIFILVERLKEGGLDNNTEVQVMFEGHLLSKRKAFESIINLSQNVLVTNFDPGAWGEQYLENVKRMADKGFGYPQEAPRTHYKFAKSQSAHSKKRS
jgi:hypothetical protein